MLFYQILSFQRKALGISQSELAFQSGLSLPTIQKLEAGSGNPSLETLEALLPHLGYRFRFEPRGADWEYLKACGLPLTSSHEERVKTKYKARLQPQKLLTEIRAALVEIASSESESRKKEALLALLLALKIHYPPLYQKLRRSQLLSQFEKYDDNPKLIKLKRLALSGLSKFL